MTAINWQRHGIYWIYPALAMIAMYFSDISWLMAAVAPAVNRELGLLESLQSLALLAIVAIAGWRLRQSVASAERGLFLLILTAAAFMLLEELDYGTHHWWLLNGWDVSEKPKINLHNYDNDAYLDWYKKGGDALLTLWFVVFPWLGRGGDNPYIRFLRPSRLFTLAFLVAIILSDLAHYLGDTIPPTPHYLDGTIGEFREFFTYYIGLTYCYILALVRVWPQPRPDSLK